MQNNTNTTFYVLYIIQPCHFVVYALLMRLQWETKYARETKRLCWLTTLVALADKSY